MGKHRGIILFKKCLNEGETTLVTHVFIQRYQYYIYFSLYCYIVYGKMFINMKMCTVLLQFCGIYKTFS
jgi:hypothetical protein